VSVRWHRHLHFNVGIGFKLPSSTFRKLWYFLEAMEPSELQRWHQFNICKHRKCIRKFRNTSISSPIVRLVNMRPSVTWIVSVIQSNKHNMTIFIVAPCILKSMLFTHQQMHYLLNLGRFKIYTNIAPTCFDLQLSSGSLYWTWLKLH
jgi:hypothetical protein